MEVPIGMQCNMNEHNTHILIPFTSSHNCIRVLHLHLPWPTSENMLYLQQHKSIMYNAYLMCMMLIKYIAQHTHKHKLMHQCIHCIDGISRGGTKITANAVCILNCIPIIIWAPFADAQRMVLSYIQLTNISSKICKSEFRAAAFHCIIMAKELTAEGR